MLKSGDVCWFMLPWCWCVVCTRSCACAFDFRAACRIQRVSCVAPILADIRFEADVDFDVGNMIIQLVVTVLVPLIVGRLLRYIKGVPELVKKYKWQVAHSVTLRVPWGHALALLLGHAPVGSRSRNC
jgi:hypothetical protein